MKRTNPGIAGEKSATIIFDIVNTDLEHYLEGFIWCQSPDDAWVESVYGAGTGSGAQYTGPLIIMEKGPSQKSMTFTIAADTPGDKNAGCRFKYIPYKEEESASSSKPVEFANEPVVLDTATGKNVKGYVITFKGYTAAVEAKNATETEPAVEAKPAIVKIDVDGMPQDIEVGKEAVIKGVTVKVNKADDKGAEIQISGKEVVTTKGATVKNYLKMDNTYTTERSDRFFREVRLDKTVPFADKSKVSEAACPQGKEICKASEIVDVGGMKIPKWALIVGALVVILLVAYLLGKSSRS